jgi:hypothetical protein
MWIFVGVLLAFLVWFFLKLSIVSLYVLLFAGIILGVVPMLMKRGARNGRETH